MNETEQPKIIYVPAFQETQSAGDEIDLLEVWRSIWAGKKFILGFTLACTLVAVLISLFVLPVTYRSEAVLIPAAPQDNTGPLTGLAGLATNLPISLGFPLDQKTNSIMSFLASRNLKERLIKKYTLLPRLYPDLWDAKNNAWLVSNPKDKPTVVMTIQEKVLNDIYSVSQNKDSNLVTISWIDKDPAFAAQMLDNIVKELSYYLDNEYETDAARERGFVEDQLAKATKDLDFWEQQLPSQNLPLAKIEREQYAARTVYTELRKQLELAKITEAKGLVRFKVLDAPMVPEKRYRPIRSLICALVLVLSGGMAIFFVLVRQTFRKHRLTLSARIREN